MARWLRILTLVAFLAPVTGASTFVRVDPCADECGGESAAAEACGADCTLCACCPGGRVLPSMVTTFATPPIPARTIAVAGIDLPGAPDPREILHVPKLLLA